MSSLWPWLTVDLELTNACRQRCSFCPHSAITRPIGQMSAPVWQRVLEQLTRAGSRVTLCGMGDPLLHPAWSTIVATLKLEGLSVGLQVSAGSLTPRTIAELVATRPSFVDVSLATHQPERLETLLRVPCGSTLIEHVIQLARAARGHFAVTVVGLQTASDDSRWRNEFAEYWRTKDIASRVLQCHRRGGHLHDEQLIATPPGTAQHQPCGLFATHAYVSWQGDLLACCHDLSGSTRIGSLVDTDYMALGRRKQARLRHLPHFALCNECDEPLRQLPLPPKGQHVSRRARRRYLRSLKTMMPS